MASLVEELINVLEEEEKIYMTLAANGEKSVRLLLMQISQSSRGLQMQTRKQVMSSSQRVISRFHFLRILPMYLASHRSR